MLHLLHSAALWTLAGLALPLAIHLWRPPPRTVRLGSLRFLENAPRRPLRNLRWRELLLLCARLSLLAVLSFLLAAPYWVVPPPAGPRLWALLDPTAAPAGESLARWQNLRVAGYELRHLAPGFPAATGEPSPSAAAGSVVVPDLWSLLREADAELPAGSTLVVFSPVRLAALRGVRPALGHCGIEWCRTPDAAGTVPQDWVASVSGSRVLTGRSDAGSTVFTVKLPADSGTRPPASPATSVLILHDAEHRSDARYVEAAVRAAADSVGQHVNIQNRDLTPDAENAAVTDWVFWLSPSPVAEGLAGRVPRIVRYAGAAPLTAADWIVAPSRDAADEMRLWKHAAAAPQGSTDVTMWTDGQGDPVLTYSHPTAGERWDLYTRFDPAWTDLPRTAALPASLRALLFPKDVELAGTDPVHDLRQADPTQGYPAKIQAATIPALAPTDQLSRNLHWPLWSLAAALFAVERILSLRRRVPAVPSVPIQRELAAASR